MHKPFIASLKRTALLCIDLQEEHRCDERYLVDGYGDVLAKVARLQAAARAVGVAVVHLAYIVDAGKVPLRRFHPLMADGRSAFSDAADPGTAICPEVAPVGGEAVLVKANASAFSHADFEPVLQERAIETLIVTGVWTEACVAATVKDAVDRGFRVVLVKDACGSGTHAMHATAIINLANRLYGGAVVDSLQALTLLADGHVAAWQVVGAVPLRFGFDDAAEVYAGL
ncbi:MAG: isochorismatase family protein [Rhizobiaceae bacterium]|nr:isochorismatase family protein [Rhizobiaceae bacterium]